MSVVVFVVSPASSTSTISSVGVVAVAASSAFLTPIGHQSNTLVMGPGGYAFKDYFKMGLPISILITIGAIPLILFFWPL